MTESTTITLSEALDLLGQWLQVERTAKEQYDARLAVFQEETAALSERITFATSEVRRLRSEVERLMAESGIRTMEGDGFQVQRPKLTKLEITNLDVALAHIADLDKLPLVQRVTIDEAAVLNLAKANGGLDGVEEVTRYGFKVVADRSKRGG